RLLRAHRHDDHLAVATGFLDLQRLLDRMHVECVHGALARAVEPLRRRVDPLVNVRLGHLLDADGDLHRRDSTLHPPRARRHAAADPPAMGDAVDEDIQRAAAAIAVVAGGVALAAALLARGQLDGWTAP